METRKIVSTVLAVVFIAIGPAWGAKTRYVAVDGDDNNGGTSWEDAFATIQKGIDEANDGISEDYAVVRVGGGTYRTVPIKLNNDNQHIILKSNTLIWAKNNNDPSEPGEFNKYNDRLFTGSNRSNIIFDGNDTTLRMNRDEYGPYTGSNGQMHAIGLFSCSNVKIRGLNIEDTGGDGIFVGSSGGDYKYKIPSMDILIEEVKFTNLMRCGIMVWSVVGLTVQDCKIVDSGYIGIEIESDWKYQRLYDITMRNITITGSKSHSLVVNCMDLDADNPKSEYFEPKDISITLENIEIKDGRKYGISVTHVWEDGPDGFIKFKNVTVDNTVNPGASLYKKSSLKAHVSFEDCVWKNIRSGDRVIVIGSGTDVQSPGGIEFINCQVFDNEDRPAIETSGQIKEGGIGLYEVHGDIYVHNDNRDWPYHDWNGAELHNVDIVLHSDDVAPGYGMAHNETHYYSTINSTIDDANDYGEINVPKDTHYEKIDFDDKPIPLRSRDYVFAFCFVILAALGIRLAYTALKFYYYCRKSYSEIASDFMSLGTFIMASVLFKAYDIDDREFVNLKNKVRKACVYLFVASSIGLIFILGLLTYSGGGGERFPNVQVNSTAGRE